MGHRPCVLAGMRTPKTSGNLGTVSRAPSLFTGLPEVDAATQEVVQQLSSQPFQWNKREETPLEAARKSLALSGNEKVHAGPCWSLSFCHWSFCSIFFFL